MNKDTLLEVLNSKSERLSLQEVYNILNEELEKSPEEMDTDLIERCMDAIESASSEKVNSKRMKMRVKTALLAAVIFVVVISISIPVCAKYFNINVPDGIVEFYGDHFNINISNKEYVDDILVELEKNGIKDPVLPTIVFLEDTKIYDFQNISDSGNKTLCFEFNSKNIKGAVTLQVYKNQYEFENVQNKRVLNVESFESIKKDEIEIILSNDGEYMYIEYVANNYQYLINLDCDYETAYEIANSI